MSSDEATNWSDPRGAPERGTPTAPSMSAVELPLSIGGFVVDRSVSVRRGGCCDGVYFGVDAAGREAAIKVFAPSDLVSEAAQRHVTWEIAVHEYLTQVGVPNVVPTLGSGTTPEGQPWLALRFLRGEEWRPLVGALPRAKLAL